VPDITPAELEEALTEFRLVIVPESPAWNVCAERLERVPGTIADPRAVAGALHRELGAYAARTCATAPDAPEAPLTPEALAAEIDKIAESYAQERQRCAASGDQQGAAVNSAINVTYRADAKRIRERLVPAWTAKDAAGRERIAKMALAGELAEVRADRDRLQALIRAGQSQPAALASEVLALRKEREELTAQLALDQDAIAENASLRTELAQLRQSAEYAAEAGAAIAVVEEREQRGQRDDDASRRLAEFLAIYDRYKADEVSAAGAWGDVVRLVEGIPEREERRPVVVTWDHGEGIDVGDLADAVRNVSGGAVVISEIGIEISDHVIVVACREVGDEEGEALWLARHGGDDA
jgi:hypothetical protein